jgi:hypothetical protein
MDSPTELSVRNFLSAMFPSEKVALWIFAILWIFFSVAGSWLWYRQWQWDIWVRDWEQVDGVITCNRFISGSRHRSSRTELRYRYTYRGREYEGSRIVYDLNRYPRGGVGSVRRIIVDPAAPERSAALVTFGRYGGGIRYADAVLTSAVAVIIMLIGGRLLLRRQPEIPEKLTRYLMTVPADGNAGMERPPRLREFGGWVSHAPRFGGGPGCCMLGNAAWGTRLWVAAQAAVAGALLWHDQIVPGLVVAAFAMLFGLGAFPPRLKFDFVTRTIRRSRSPWRNAAGPEETLPYSAIRRLEVIPARMEKPGMFALLVAVTGSEEAWVLGKFAQRRIPVLLAFLPELATELGHLPIVFHAEVLEPEPSAPRKKTGRKNG